VRDEHDSSSLWRRLGSLGALVKERTKSKNVAAPGEA
jgi:hypothetical protein